MTTLFRATRDILRLELTLFSRFPPLRTAALGIVFIPALYALIYLLSVWDPASKTAALPAFIINLDQGTTVRDQTLNLGRELVASLQQKRAFGFVEAHDVDAAKKQVRDGHSLFALIIPADFSANALSGATPGAGKLILYASEGNNFTGAGFAKRFAAELGHQVNELLNARRWQVVLGSVDTSSHSLARLHDGIAQLQSGARMLDTGLSRALDGSQRLAAGTDKLSEGTGQVADGMKQVGAGLRQLDTKKPAADDLQKLKGAGQQLVAGELDLQKGLTQLYGGSDKLVIGLLDLRTQSQAIPLVGSKLAAGETPLVDGAEHMRSALRTAMDGQSKLVQGAQSYHGAITQMADGFGAYAAGVATLAAKFPPDDNFTTLATGGKAVQGAARQLEAGLGQLKSGSAQLQHGLDVLASALPAQVEAIPGTPQGLAGSVEPELQIDAPVPNNGSGFTPNFIPVALWLGAVMASYLFQVRRFAAAARGQSRLALLLARLGTLWPINVAQAVVVFLMVALILGIDAVHPLGLAVTMLVAALTFSLVVLALVRAFGDTGKALALILLILQLSAAGGVMPIELTNAFYRSVSPWLPFTWVVKAVRASMFGAYESDWLAPVGIVCLFALGAFVIALFVGRWRFVGADEHRPALDI